MDVGKTIKGYARKLFLVEDIADRFDIPKRTAFELKYIATNDIAVLFPDNLTAEKLVSALNKLQTTLQSRLNAEKIYESINKKEEVVLCQ